MSGLNQITHPNAHIAKKVNFFVDYYHFSVEQIGRECLIENENYLSLLDKIVFQIETNFDNCPKYLDNYLTHPLFSNDNKFIKQYPQLKTLKQGFKEYLAQGKPSQKRKWINDNRQFISSIRRSKKYLERCMFKKALKAIISFLKCRHEISHHQEELFHFTNILVSEILLNERAKEDLTKVFYRILSNDPSTFPFPESFLKKNKHRLKEAKEEFISKRSFDQQFEGIYNFFKEKNYKVHYIFRIDGVTSHKNFCFKYNKVTFYHPEHEKLKNAVVSSKEDTSMVKNFFEKERILLAIVKVDYYSNKIAENAAINIVKEELEFLNNVCGSNGHLEKYSYLTTVNFKNFGGRWATKERGFNISEFDAEDLKRNPYKFLSKVNPSCKKHFLSYEPLFLKATISRNPSDIWHYLETLIAAKDSKDTLDTISKLLLLRAVHVRKLSLRTYIYDSISTFSTPAKLLEITPEIQKEFLRRLRKKGDAVLHKMNRAIIHPFLKYLIKEYLYDMQKSDFITTKNYYSRILLEAYAQRNAIVHDGRGNEKALIQLDVSLIKLASWLRWTLFEGMRNHKDLNFIELIEALKIQSDKLVSD